MLQVVADTLALEGYTVLRTGDPHEALRWARARTGPIDLLVTDVAMPRMNGPVLAERLRAAHSEAKVLFMSGSTVQELHDYGVRIESGEAYLAKPFSLDDLRRKVEAALDFPTLVSRQHAHH